ncbi:NEAT domain-containing protein [Paraliobacillus zengyii]|uniref:NEAT domain-containing protein n=1 Tax=Paraliobacillus zengyii TaxID=2213194 RepID=UPI000DD40FDE|nr:NEAT domain-containing protein [Paraliobacillus zengyii]
MKKSFKILIALFVVIFTVLPQVQPAVSVVAAEQELSDGAYTIDYDVFYQGAETVFGKYFSTPAELTVENGKKYISFTASSSNIILSFETEFAGQYSEAEVVSEDTVNETRVIKFEVENLTETNVKLVMSYGMTHDIQLKYDQASITEIELETSETPEETETPVESETPEETETPVESETPEETETPVESETPEETETPVESETPGETETPVENEDIEIEDGDYTIDYDIFYQGEEAPRYASYFSTPAELTVEDGDQYISFTVSSGDVIVSLETEFEGEFSKAEVVSEDTVNHTRVVKFEVENLTETNVKIVMSYGMSHEIQLVYDQESITEVIETPVETETPEETETPIESETPEEEETPAQNDGDEIEDGDYTIDYDVFYQGEETSFGSYFSTPAILTVEDGKQYVSFTTSRSDVIVSFETEYAGEYTKAEIVSEDLENQTRQLKFEVEDLTETNVKLVMSYGMTHEIQLVYDQESITEVVETPEQEESVTAKPVVSNGMATIEDDAVDKVKQDGELVVNVDQELTIELSLSSEQVQQLKTKNVKLIIVNKETTVSILASELPDGEFKFNVDVIEDVEGSDQALSKIFDFNISNKDTFEQPVTLQFNVDPNSVGNKDIEVRYYNESTKEWESIGGNYQDGIITAETNHFSIYGVFEIVEESPETPEEDTTEDQELADGEYDLPLSVLSVDSDSSSAFEKYFTETAILKVVDGKYTIVITQNDYNLSALGAITFEINGVEHTLVEQSKDDETRVLTLDIDEIQSSYTATIEAIGAPHLYPVRFVFDLSELEIDVVDEGETGSNDEENPTSNTDNTDNIVDNVENSINEESNENGPEFDRDADTDNATESVSSDSETEENNAKTGDAVQIGMYLLFLLGSLSYLVVRYRSNKFRLITK